MNARLRRLFNLLAVTRLRRMRCTVRIGDGSPVDVWRIRGGAGAELSVGAGTLFESRLAFERENARVSVGNRTFVGGGQISCASRVEIGDDVLIAWGVTVFDHDSHALRFSDRASDVTAWLEGRKDWSAVQTAPVRVMNRAWIGFGCILLPGVTIGEGAVVGAGSVVSREVEPWCVAAGNPARVVRKLGPDER
jgi:galactoside O-acetyltransferase